MAAYDEIFRRTARVFEELCRLAGERELAEKVRPSSTCPGRTVAEPEVVPEEVLDLEDLPPPGGEPAAQVSEPDPVKVREPQPIEVRGRPGKSRETIAPHPPERPGCPGRPRSCRAPPVVRASLNSDSWSKARGGKGKQEKIVGPAARRQLSP